MKKLLPALLLGLAGRPALAAVPPTVPATLDVAGLHLTLDRDARQLVQAKVNSLCRHQASFEASVALAEAAFPLIDQVLAEEGVPADFRYLALQESALQGNAQSVHGAVGYWQLKRETALGLGLTVNGTIDERRHLTASTRAAARYLAHNNASLHNWANALLSYNLGLGGVRPFLSPTDADATQLTITASTNPYILTFLAQKLVFEPACAQQAVPFVPLREVPAAPGQSLAQQAAAYTLDPAVLARLNPWLLAATVPQDGYPYTLLVPQASAPAPAASPGPVVPAAFITVNGIKTLLAQPGDTPASLAERGGASLGFFLKVNELTGNEALIPGEPYFFQRKKEVAAEDYHVVATGQSLTAVAQHYGVLRHALRAYNHLGSDEAVRPGLVLWLSHARPRSLAPEYQPVPVEQPVVPCASASSAESAPEPSTREPDELATINETGEPASAAALPTEVPGMPVASLPTPPTVAVAIPSLSDNQPSITTITVSALQPTPPMPALPVAATSTYYVAPGETLYALARRLGVRPAELAAWNNLALTAALRAGQLLRLSAQPSAPELITRPPTPGSEAYVVAAGDTFFSISRRYKCTVAELLAHNGKEAPSLRVGETLRVPHY